jgi:predicted RNase H-like HicB family nuclease
MHNEFTAIVEQDGDGFIAYCAEVPGANGQGLTKDECLGNLREAIALMLEFRREESFRSVAARLSRCCFPRHHLGSQKS